MTKPILPRDGAIRMEIPSTKGENITFICSMGDHLAIYSPSETFKVQTPEVIDPDRTNPNAMFVNVKTHDVGSSSPFVARTILMTSEMVKNRLVLKDDEKRNLLLKNVNEIKEALLQCAAASDAYLNALSSADDDFSKSGYSTTAHARAFKSFPILPDIEAKCTAFLIAARRCISEICQIQNHFFATTKHHTSLEHLLSKELSKILGDDDQFVKFLRDYIDGTKRIIDLRNGQEHASTTKDKRLYIHNFTPMPTNQIRRPTWQLGEAEPDDIASEMKQIPSFLLELAEAMIVGCVAATLPEWPPTGIVVVDPIDPNCPIHYRLEIDGNRLLAQAASAQNL